MDRAVAWYHERLLNVARRAPGARVPARARHRGRARSPVPARLGARRVGRPYARAQAQREGPRGDGARLRQQARPSPGRAARPGDLSDLRSGWQGHRRRRTDPSRRSAERPRRARRTQVQEQSRDARSTPSAARSTRLNFAKDDVIKSGEIIVCEGYTDVIAFFAAGLPRAVATCGTALGEEHFRLMRNFAKRIVLAYDADAAGQSAAASVYQWERQHEVDVAVARLPKGTRPGRAGPARPRGPAPGRRRRRAVPALPARPRPRGRQTLNGRGPGSGGESSRWTCSPSTRASSCGTST